MFNEAESDFTRAWNQVQIIRKVQYSLFTFGATDLEYYLVLQPSESNEQVSVSQGVVTVTRPLIISPNDYEPEFQGFFENAQEEALARFLLARTASFSQLKLVNRRGPQKFYSNSTAEVIDQLTHQLDLEEEDRIAVLQAPYHLAGIALMRYTTERVLQSAPGNIQELQERGFLPS